MVLRGDVTLLGAAVDAGLVAATVSVRKLDGAAPDSEGEELVPETNTENRRHLRLCLGPRDGFLENSDGFAAFRRVTRAVGEEETVVLIVGIVVIPRYNLETHIETHELTNDIELHTCE